jgi:hypothetical protein
MQPTINFVGIQPNEQTPNIALYSIDARGAAHKIIAASEGKLDLGRHASERVRGTIAIGPDVPDPSTLDASLLQKLSAEQALPEWEQSAAVQVAAQWWRRWLPITVCLTGQVRRCWPILIDRKPFLRNLALARVPFPPHRSCAPICNGVVEIWESTCCCFPFLVSHVPPLIEKLKAFLAANPIMFPSPPRPGPDPGPIDRALTARVDRAFAAGKVDYRFAPNAQLHEDLQALEASSPQDAVQYFTAHPSLWPIWCHCSSFKLGNASLQPDGGFQFCYEQYPFILWPCYRSYFYRVYQQQGSQSVCIYDGAAAHQYFAADDFASLTTLQGAACGTTNPPPGTDFVCLQQIGFTSTHVLHSNYGVPSALNVDTTQTGEYSVAAPPNNGGLVDFGGETNAPWCKSLRFMLYFDPGMETSAGAYYYRVSVAPADLNGNPVGTMQPILMPPWPVVWSKYALGSSGIETDTQSLGPNAVTNSASTLVQGLYVIPYQSTTVQPAGSTSPDQDWEGGQFHLSYDTTTLNPGAAHVPGPGNGRFLLAVEVFNKNGDRLVPPGVVPGPGDVAASFSFVRLMPTPTGPGSTANVPYAALTHLIWADNRKVGGTIDSFTLSGASGESGAQCQFLSGAGSDAFQVGYHAYHAVMSDDLPPPGPTPANPIPPSTFMQSFTLTWERGLNGCTGTLDSGGDIDQPTDTSTTGSAGLLSQLSPAVNGQLSNLLPYPLTSPTVAPLCGSPQPPWPTTVPPNAPFTESCSFAIELNVYSKHTDGISHYDDLDAYIPAAVALSRTSA